MVSTVKGHTWILGDFNYPIFSWTNNISTIFPDCEHPHQYKEFTEFNLTQLVTLPTRFENIIDSFLIDNPTLVKSVEVRPGIADHDTVLPEVFIKPQVNKQKPRLMFSTNTQAGRYSRTFLASHVCKSNNLVWEEFKGAL